ncbi:MAG: hypothetical protein ACREH8_21355, partial [Opitutaceae bacterium]
EVQATLRDAKIFPHIPWAEAHGYGRTSLRESQCIRRICGPSAGLARTRRLDTLDALSASKCKQADLQRLDSKNIFALSSGLLVSG